MWENHVRLSFSPKGPLILSSAKLVRKIAAVFDISQGDLWFVLGQCGKFAAIKHGVEGEKLIAECFAENFDAQGKYRYRMLPYFFSRRHTQLWNAVDVLQERAKKWAIVGFKTTRDKEWRLVPSYGLSEEEIHRELFQLIQRGLGPSDKLPTG